MFVILSFVVAALTGEEVDNHLTNVSYELVADFIIKVSNIALLPLSWFYRKRVLRLLEYLSPWLRRRRFLRSNCAKSIRRNSNAVYVPIDRRAKANTPLFESDAQLLKGAFVLHGSINAGKWTWVRESILDDKCKCDAYEIIDYTQILPENYEKFKEVLTTFLRGTHFSLFGVPKHKAFIIEVPPSVKDSVVIEMRDKLEEYCSAQVCPLTFVLKTEGFLSFGSRKLDDRAIRIEVLSPTECLDFIKHEVWPVDVSETVRKKLLGDLKTPLSLVGANSFDARFAQSLWISTLGQPDLLQQQVKNSMAENAWKAHLKLIVDQQDKQYAIGDFIAFLTFLALLAEFDENSSATARRNLTWSKLATCFGVGPTKDNGYRYEYVADILSTLFGYDILQVDKRMVDLHHLICPETAEAKNRNRYFFANRYEALSLIFRWGRFERRDLSAVVCERVSAALMNNDLGLSNEDRARAGRNLARAIIDSCPWNKWNDEYERLKSEWPLTSEVSGVKDAFETEFKRLREQHSLLSRLEACIDCIKPDELASILKEICSLEIPDSDYLLTVLRAVRLIAATYTFKISYLSELKVDFERLKRLCKTDGELMRERFYALALFYIDIFKRYQQVFLLSQEELDLQQQVESFAKYIREQLTGGFWECFFLDYFFADFTNEEEKATIRQRLVEAARQKIPLSNDQFLSDALLECINETFFGVLIDGESFDFGYLLERSGGGLYWARDGYLLRLQHLFGSTDSWSEIKKHLNAELRPDSNIPRQAFLVIEQVLDHAEIVDPADLRAYVKEFLVQQKDWRARFPDLTFLPNFARLGLTILKYDYSEDLAAYTQAFKEVILSGDDPELISARVLGLNPTEFVWFWNVGSELLQKEVFDERECLLIKTLGWLGMLWMVQKNCYANEYRDKYKAIFSGDTLCVETAAETFYAITLVLTETEFPQEYPDAEECCRRSAELWLSESVPRPITRIPPQDIRLVIYWISLLLRVLHHDPTVGLVRDAFETIGISL